jgi:hypothetical protein
MPITCTESSPIYWDNTDNVFRPLTGNPIHFVQGQNWNYSVSNCTGTLNDISTSTDRFFEIQHPTSTAGNFFIDKTFSYGEIALTSGLLFLTFLFIFFLLRYFLFPKEVEIHSIHKKVF